MLPRLWRPQLVGRWAVSDWYARLKAPCSPHRRQQPNQGAATERDDITLPPATKEKRVPPRDPDKSRRQALAGAIVAVTKAARDGGVMFVDRHAQRLLSEYPDCGMSFAELREELARLAVQQGVNVEFGVSSATVSE